MEIRVLVIIDYENIRKDMRFSPETRNLLDRVLASPRLSCRSHIHPVAVGCAGLRSDCKIFLTPDRSEPNGGQGNRKQGLAPLKTAGSVCVNNATCVRTWRINMSSNFRWLAIASMALNLLLLQAMTEQTTEFDTLVDESNTYTATIAQLQAENEAAQVELAVINVLDSHRLRVTPTVRHEIATTILEAAHRYDLAPELILAVMFTESSFDPAAESEVGALGLMQIMPATASQLARELEMEWKGRQLLTDPESNILMGSFYLRKLLHRFDDLNVALAAYNVGPNRLRTIMTEEDRVPRLYARKVQELTAALREQFF